MSAKPNQAQAYGILHCPHCGNEIHYAVSVRHVEIWRTAELRLEFESIIIECSCMVS
jgi:hypothetical protein